MKEKKVSQFCPKVAQKVVFFKNAILQPQKLPNNWAFCKKFCQSDLEKVAQSGHTDYHQGCKVESYP